MALRGAASAKHVRQVVAANHTNKQPFACAYPAAAAARLLHRNEGATEGGDQLKAQGNLQYGECVEAVEAGQP